MKFKQMLGLLFAISIFVLVGCAEQQNLKSDIKEQTATSKEMSKEELAEKILTIIKEEPADEKIDLSQQEKLRTSNNGVVKFVGMTGDEVEVGYKEYSIPSGWTLDTSRTILKDVDVVWLTITNYPYHY